MDNNKPYIRHDIVNGKPVIKKNVSQIEAHKTRLVYPKNNMNSLVKEIIKLNQVTDGRTHQIIMHKKIPLDEVNKSMMMTPNAGKMLKSHLNKLHRAGYAHTNLGAGKLTNELSFYGGKSNLSTIKRQILVEHDGKDITKAYLSDFDNVKVLKIEQPRNLTNANKEYKHTIPYMKKEQFLMNKLINEYTPSEIPSLRNFTGDSSPRTPR